MIKKLLLFVAIATTAVAAGQAPDYTSFGLQKLSPGNCTAVKDQYLSSTCWSFSSLSFLESELLRQRGETIDLSEMFIARFSMIRKIERHLALKGGNYFTPGGQFHDVQWVWANMGLVPESAYPGKPATQLHHDHSKLDTLLSHLVEDCIAQHITKLTPALRQYTDSLLDHYLGKVPDRFVYKGKTYSPKTFAQDYLKLDPKNYIEITSYTHHPFYRQFALEDKYNWSGDLYYNVPIDVFSSITNHALDKGYTVGWDGDSEDPGFNFEGGVAWLDSNQQNTQEGRQAAFETQATLLTHMMHIVKKTVDREGRTWYYIKNSWGNYSNPLNGFLFMRDDYFRIRTDAIFVNKNAIDPGIRKRLNI